MIVKTAPDEELLGGFSVFLAGSIEQGTARDWQTQVINALTELDGVIYNPRRPSWSPLEEANLVFQITWELERLELADLVVFVFDPATKSPITLAELGLLAGLKKNAVVFCPDNFWRSTNVKVMCERYSMPYVDSIECLIQNVFVYAAKHTQFT